VLTVSGLARASYLDAGVAEDKVHALPLGADTALFRPRPRGAETQPVRFLFCGASIRRKAFDVLAEAFASVASEAADVELRVIGPRGDQALLLDRLPRGRVTTPGPLPQAALAEELASADCLVLPSRSDSYGMVVAEALASGRPVIVSDQVGAKDLVASGANGWIVPAGDVAALRERMLWCARHPAELRAMFDASRRSAERASWDAYGERLAGLIRELVARR
jgi:glycosyltransferase involved in cell wall biosynthesis